MVGVCVVAVFAIAAIAASSASALPEWGKCVVQAKHEGKYTDSNCTSKAKKVEEKFTGEFEFIKGKELAPVKFAGHNIGSGGVLFSEFAECKPGAERISRKKCVEKGEEVVADESTEGALTIECESENNTGQAESTNKVSNVNVTFKGCSAFGVFPCNSAGSAEGEVKTNVLRGKLGYINKSAKEVGVLLEPVKKHGKFAEFTCGGFLETFVGVGNETEGAVYSPEKTGGYDGIISPITPVNQMTTQYTQVYTVNATLENIPTHFQGKHIELLEDYIQNGPSSTLWSRAAEEITNENTAEEIGEIKG